jgi:2',3'-cyclic-nucleotide 2'-phosphodiesterase
MTILRLLTIGDIFARTGRYAVQKVLPGLIAGRSLDFVIANGENIAGGVGITPELADELFDFGVDVLTSGNHIWRQREIRTYIQKQPRLLRPCNYAASQPGNGFGIFETAGGIRVAVINVSGQVFMDVNPDNPFTAVDAALREMTDARVRIVDFHAEATSEKRAMGYHLNGRVSALVGTHTHVQTADEQILSHGTGFLSDLGMTGPHDSIIGMRKDTVLGRFVTGMPEPFKPAASGARFQGCLFEVDTDTGHTVAIERIDIPVSMN